MQYSTPPLIAHVIHSLKIGGLENGLVNLINGIPASRFRHAVICIDDYSDFSNRIQREDVEIYAMYKKPGRDPALFIKLFKLFRKINPAILHSRNLAGLDSLLPATLARIPYKIHGEHGREINDVDGSNRKLQWIRRLHKGLVDTYVPLSKDLERYLRNKIGVPQVKIRQIYNGVDTDRHCPRNEKSREIVPQGFIGKGQVIIGTVGRLRPEKDQMNLAKAFLELLKIAPEWRSRLRLLIVGDGSLIEPIKETLKSGGAIDQTWLPGARNDVSQILALMDIFVLPSLAEGVSNTILEAMASALPVVATDVGGNGELVEANKTGLLVPSNDPIALAKALETYVYQPDLRKNHGRAGRLRVETQFSLETMVNNYLSLYDEAIA